MRSCLTSFILRQWSAAAAAAGTQALLIVQKTVWGTVCACAKHPTETWDGKDYPDDRLKTIESHPSYKR